MNRVCHLIRRLLSVHRPEERGVAFIAIAAALVVAGSATVFTLRSLDQRNLLNDLRGSRSNMEDVVGAILAYAVQNTQLPCPANGPAGDGVAGITSNDCDDPHGVVPWFTLNLSPEAVQGPGGAVYSYVTVAHAAGNMNYCDNVDGAATGQAEAGRIVVREFDGSSVVTASGSPVVAAIIDHGPNNAGGFFPGGGSTQDPPSSLERYNCSADQTNCMDPGAGDLEVLIGPVEIESVTNYFDDVVRLITQAEVAEFCEEFVANGGVNNFINDDFSGGVDTTNTYTAATSGSFSGTISGESSSFDSEDEIAQFGVTAAGGVGLVTQADFETTAVPIYISVEYRPENVSGANISFSVTTRTDISTTLGAPDLDLFTDGITFRFDRAAGSDITPTIRTSGSTIATGSTLSFTDDRPYLIEVFDNGVTAWARITDTVTSSNTSTVFAPDNTLTEDTTPPNGIGLVLQTTDAGGATAEIDDLLVARGIGTYEPDGTGDYIVNTADTSTIETALTDDFTLEAWIRPDALPSSSSELIMSKWDSGGTAAAQSFQFRLGTSNNLELVVSDGSSSSHTFSTSHSLRAGEWSHVGVSYDGDGSSQAAVQFYQNGTARGGALSSTNVNTVVDSSAPFIAGTLREETGSTTGNSFAGDMAELRLWSDVRSSSEIGDNFDNRLSSSPAGLLVYWPLNVDDTNGGSVGFAGEEALGGGGTSINGTLTGNNTWAGAQDALFLLPFASDMCGSNATGFFECSYTSATDSTAADFPDNVTHSVIPAEIPNLYVEAWGAGGGGYSNTTDRNGGGGGYTAASFLGVGGDQLIITVGGGGTRGNMSSGLEGAGGGGKSEVEFNTVGNSAIIAGGGGGAGHSTSNADGASCGEPTRSGTSPQWCGDGGAGGGGSTDGQNAYQSGTTCAGVGASGASAGAGGADLTACTGANQEGSAGQASASGGDGGNGGASGAASNGGTGDASSDGAGGNGGSETVTNGGGGGGGGFSGGGGGASIDGNDGSYGGGGGSGNVGSPTGVTLVGSGAAGDGYEPSNSNSTVLPNANARGGQGANDGGDGTVVIRW